MRELVYPIDFRLYSRAALRETQEKYAPEIESALQESDGTADLLLRGSPPVLQEFMNDFLALSCEHRLTGTGQ